MPMTKAEKARMDELENGIRLAKAMRWPDYPEPAPFTKAEIEANLVEGGERYGRRQMIARGWFASTYNDGSVSYGCSDGTNCNPDGDKTTSQGMGRMFKCEADAWRYLRVKLTEKFAKDLARIDGKISEASTLTRNDRGGAA